MAPNGYRAPTGTELRRARRARELSQEAIATATGYSRPYISLVERGLLRPSERFERAASAALGVEQHRLFARQGSAGDDPQTRELHAESGGCGGIASGPAPRSRGAQTTMLGAGLTVEDVRLLLGACSTRSSSGLRARALIMMLVHGLKLSEALALLPGDVEGDQLAVRGIGTRTVPLSAWGMEAVDLWCERQRRLGLHDRPPLFSTYTGRPLSPAYVRQLLPRLGRRAGVPRRVHSEALRRVPAPPCLCGPSAKARSAVVPAADLLARAGEAS